MVTRIWISIVVGALVQGHEHRTTPLPTKNSGDESWQSDRDLPGGAATTVRDPRSTSDPRAANGDRPGHPAHRLGMSSGEVPMLSRANPQPCEPKSGPEAERHLAACRNVAAGSSPSSSFAAVDPGQEACLRRAVTHSGQVLRQQGRSNPVLTVIWSTTACSHGRARRSAATEASTPRFDASSASQRSARSRPTRSSPPRRCRTSGPECSSPWRPSRTRRRAGRPGDPDLERHVPRPRQDQRRVDLVDQHRHAAPVTHSAMAVRSSRDQTRPSGLCGLHSR